MQRFVHQKLHAIRTKMFRHLHCEAHRTRSAVEVQHEGNITRSASFIRSFTQIRQESSSSSIFNAKPTGPDQPLRFSLALPLRPYHPQRFIHQKLHPNPTRMFKHQCEAHRTSPAADVQLGSSPSGHITRSASSIRSFTHIRQESSSSSIFNAKPTGPDQPLRFSMALPLKPYHPQRFIHQKLHPNPTRIFKQQHLQCEAHRTRSAADLQHGSSPSGHITRSASSIRSFTQI